MPAQLKQNNLKCNEIDGNVTDQFVHKLRTRVKMNGFYFHSLIYQNNSKISLGQLILFYLFICKYVWNNYWDTISTKDHDNLLFCFLDSPDTNHMDYHSLLLCQPQLPDFSFLLILLPCRILRLNIYDTTHPDFIYLFLCLNFN